MSKVNESFNGLTVELSALADNWRYLHSQLSATAACSAVIKANAYGVGVEPVVKRLVGEGCQHFFVANLQEALQVKPLLPDRALLFVLSGCSAGEEQAFLNNNLIPVLISQPMFLRWENICQSHGVPKPVCAVKVNTGMNRLGMEPEEWLELLKDRNRVEKAGVQWLMSHLACADEPEHALNKIQLQRFRFLTDETRAVLPGCKFSLANSAGIFLGEEYHFDLVRPGIALYGGQPQHIKHDIKPLVYLNLEVLQTRKAKAGESVGYGATFTLENDSELITVAGGYADGISRMLGNKMDAVFNGHRISQIGRVSMDSLIFDVSNIAEHERPKEGDLIEVLGEHITVNELAARANTISYEILTSLGQRYARRYLNQDSVKG